MTSLPHSGRPVDHRSRSSAATDGGSPALRRLDREVTFAYPRRMPPADTSELDALIADLTSALERKLHRSEGERREWQDNLDDAIDERRAMLARAAREAEPMPLASIAARSDRAAADAAASERASLIAMPLDPAAPAIERAALDADREREGGKRERERFAFSLYSELRSNVEIVGAIVAQFGVSEATARLDLDRVRAIVTSWRDNAEWTSRRDQHVIALRNLYDRAMHGRDFDLARKILGQIASVEGFNAPSRGLVLHGHGMVGETIAAGPGIVAGISVRAMSPAERAALRTLLPGHVAALEAPEPEIVEALDVEAVTPEDTRTRALDASGSEVVPSTWKHGLTDD